MAGNLNLNLDTFKDFDLKGQAQNIVSNISNAFENAVKKGITKIDVPENLNEIIKENIEKIDIKEIGSAATTEALKVGLNKLGMKKTTFNDLKGILDALKEGNLKDGLDSGLNVVIGMLPVSNTVKTLIKNGKSIILEQSFQDELKTVMKKQRNTISRINDRCTKMEDAFTNRDINELNKLYKQMKKDIEKVMPIKDVIDNGNRMINKYELYKSKGNFDFTKEELELCSKLA